MKTGKTSALGARETRELMNYIDYLVASRGGAYGACPLNGYRQDAMRGDLVKELSRMVGNYDSAKVPEFIKFAKAMLKRCAGKAAYRQGRRQWKRMEGAFGYESLDAPHDEGDAESEATMHDCVADEAAGMRGVRGERLRRFYRVMARLTAGERQMLEALMECDMNKTDAAKALGITRRVLRYRLCEAFAHFRAVWAGLD